jgi:MoxR-like ATPase
VAVCCLLTEGHLLVDDVPGTGKTTLAKAIAGSVAGTWKRVQFTPDLLPSDITGVMVYDQAHGTFDFRDGPVFTNVLIGDEINRGSPMSSSVTFGTMEAGVDDARRLTEDAILRSDAAVDAIRRPLTRWGRLRWLLSLRSLRRSTCSPVIA